MSLNLIKNILHTTFKTTNIFIIVGLSIFELILSCFVIKYCYKYINHYMPLLKKDYSNTLLIINNYDSYNFTMQTTKVWLMVFLDTAYYLIILSFLLLWIVMGIIGLISLFYRISKYLSKNNKDTLK